MRQRPSSLQECKRARGGRRPCSGPGAQLAERLFGVTVERADGRAPVWHPDVQFFALARDGRPKACFYLDPYSRPAGAARALPRPPRALCTFCPSCGRRRACLARKGWRALHQPEYQLFLVMHAKRS